MSQIRFNKPYEGFTIIEVLIVLAIAGLILLILFLAVPSLQRNSRNYGRKHYIAYLSAKLEDWKNNNADYYPQDEDDYCDFLLNYAPAGGNPAIGGCDRSHSGPGDCVTVKTKLYSLCFHPNYVVHNYVGKNDQVNIALSHWCNTDPARFGEPTNNPITEGHIWPYDLYNKVYVIWTPTEGGGPYSVACVDNYEADF